MFKQNMNLKICRILIPLVFIVSLSMGLLGFSCEEDPDEDDQSDCGNLCRKVQECADLGDFENNFEDLPQCIGRCKDVETDDTLSCMFGCSINLSCYEYEACLLDC